VRDRKDVALDLGIELIGAFIVAGFTWAATIGADTLALPTWAIVVVVLASGLGVVSLVTYVVRARQISRMHAELSAAQRRATASIDGLGQLRDLHRRVAEQLAVGDVPAVLKHVTSYTVDPSGHDRIDSEWTIAFAATHQGHVFVTEDWSAYAATGTVHYMCNSDSNPGTTVVPVLIVDEPTRKKTAIHLHPPVGTTQRQLVVQQTWPGLWKDLRERGADYLEMTARDGLQEGVMQVYIPDSLGNFEWLPSNTPGVVLTKGRTGAQQTLRMLISAPEAGRTYRADLRKT
jgi:hypothetical protein